MKTLIVTRIVNFNCSKCYEEILVVLNSDNIMIMEDTKDGTGHTTVRFTLNNYIRVKDSLVEILKLLDE